VKLELLNIDEIASRLPEIKSSKIVESRKFHKEGLFSPQIFGPLKSYHCECKQLSYKGPRSTEAVCPRCGVEILPSEIRKKRFAKIVLPFPVFNPLFFNLLVGNKVSIKKILSDMLQYKAKYYFNADNKLTRMQDGEGVPEGFHTMTGLTGSRNCSEAYSALT